MTQTNGPRDPSGDEYWWRVLGGEAPPEGPESIRREAERLREAVRALDSGSGNQATDPANHDARFERLLFRLRKDGLLDKPAPPVARRTKPGFKPWFAVAAGLVGFALLTPFLTTRHGIDEPAYFDEPEWKPKSMRIPDPWRVEDPRAAVEQLARLLESIGTPYGIEEHGESILLRAVLDDDANGEVGRWLRERGLQPPPDGALWLEILPARSETRIP